MGGEVIRGKFVIEIYILFAQEAEMHVHKNGELMLSTSGYNFSIFFTYFSLRIGESLHEISDPVFWEKKKTKKNKNRVFREETDVPH